jgi:cyclohexa-1,5-dienecarbonyl-CoA hydratase
MTTKATLEGGVATLTLNHPPFNILTRAVLASLRASLADWADHSSLRVLVLSAEGSHFSAGADVVEHLPPTYTEMIPEFMETIEALASFPQPVVVAVQGRCLGGGFELALAGDVIVAGEGAQFGQPEIVLGVTAPAACVLLPRRTTQGRACEMLLTGDTITAAQAREAGIVQRVVADDRVHAEALVVARRMARHSAVALRETKRSIRVSADLPRAEALRATGRIYVEDLMRTEDALEGLRAFVDKRKPLWADR